MATDRADWGTRQPRPYRLGPGTSFGLAPTLPLRPISRCPERELREVWAGPRSWSWTPWQGTLQMYVVVTAVRSLSDGLFGLYTETLLPLLFR